LKKILCMGINDTFVIKISPIKLFVNNKNLMEIIKCPLVNAPGPGAWYTKQEIFSCIK
jgi:hypothetical protein